MAEKLNVENASVNILLDVDGKIYLVAMKKDQMEAINSLVKMAATNVIPTGKTNYEFLKFLGVR